jgi:hypothetical protein
MNSYVLEIEDVGEAGSFQKRGGSNLVRVKSKYRPDLSAIVFQCILNEDNDGAPDCYGPRHPPALDPLADGTNDENAVFDPQGKNGWHWAGVIAMTPREAQLAGVLGRLDQRLSVRDRNGRFPLLQPPPNQQFFVSSTSTPANPGLPLTNQARFWNAKMISYGALTPPLTRLGVDFGDFGLAIRIDSGVNDGFLYADSGNQNKVGESSRKLFRTLFPGVDQEGHPVAFIVFPGSADRRAGGGFGSNPTLALRTRLGDLSRADNMNEVIGLMASGRKYKDFNVGTDPHNVGPFSMNSPQAQTIARALQRWGYDAEAAASRRMSEMRDELWSQMTKEAADLARLKIPSP